MSSDAMYHTTNYLDNTGCLCVPSCCYNSDSPRIIPILWYPRTVRVTLWQSWDNPRTSELHELWQRDAKVWQSSRDCQSYIGLQDTLTDECCGTAVPNIIPGLSEFNTPVYRNTPEGCCLGIILGLSYGYSDRGVLKCSIIPEADSWGARVW